MAKARLKKQQDLAKAVKELKATHPEIEQGISSYTQAAASIAATTTPLKSYSVSDSTRTLSSLQVR